LLQYITMTIRLTEHKTTHHQRMIALFFILIAAAIVAYAAITMMELNEPTMVVELPPVINLAVQPGDTLYFEAALRDTPGTSITYQYSISKQEWGPYIDYPYHGSFYPLTPTTGLLTMPNIDATSTDPTADGFKPAFLDVVSGSFSYLPVPTGYNEQHYRVAPVENGAVAYMQQSDPTADYMSIAGWEVVVYQSDQAEAALIITEAMYPQWLSADTLLLLREEGVVLYDTTTAQETSLGLLYEDFTASNQYALSTTLPDDPRLLLAGVAGKKMAVLVNDTDEYGVQTPIEIDFIQDEYALFVEPIMSPDQTRVALHAVSVDPESAEIYNEIRLYDLYFANELAGEDAGDTAATTPVPPKTVISIPLGLYDPSSIKLLGWK
jgi:hypothetical protein